MQVEIGFCLLLTIFLSVTVRESSATCYSFMGVSTCPGQDSGDEKFISGAWWFVNIHHRRTEVEVLYRHILSNSFVGTVVDSSEALRGAKKLLDTEAFWDVVGQTVAYLQEVKGEPIELLYDEDLDTMDLYRSYRQHADDILDLITTVRDEGGYEKGLHKNVPHYQDLLLQASRIVNRLPEFTQMTMFKMLEHGALSDLKETGSKHAKSLLGVSDILELASNMVPSKGTDK
ncbi:hypothetical protein BIW11_10003 [Tropilaelaps mercedesae]|uniref:Uncharacterized protein n=1 Tax=Tropilaelaps mercedesae TaxID=418985 RepID=A0A1V9XHY0_9ACAR|nr:hypothetical protein BIW11_10003 [Tropilaelaps mercedesae]